MPLMLPNSLWFPGRVLAPFMAIALVASCGGGGEEAAPFATSSWNGVAPVPDELPRDPPNLGPRIADQLLATFEAMPDTPFGGLNAGALASEFGNAFEWSVGLEDVSVLGSDDLRSLRQRYVPNSTGSPVVSFPIRIKGGPEVWLSYRVYFEPEWEWVRGGKLPGLAGGTYPSGGQSDDNGFSARLMWRENGKMCVYAYHHDRPGPYGQDFYLVEPDGSPWHAPVGRWFTITERIKVNTDGSTYDGEVQVWIDSEQKLHETGLRWRKNTSYTADTFLYSSFYGGSDPTWAPTKTTYAQFDDFKIASSRSGVDG
jgi:hypothetical protein